jgi:hypothetical protein
MWWMYFVFICENRRMKPIEILLKGGEKEKDGRSKSKI